MYIKQRRVTTENCFDYVTHAVYYRIIITKISIKNVCKIDWATDASACTMQAHAPCKHMHHTCTCIMQAHALCRHMHHASRCTVQPDAPCNQMHHATRCTMQTHAPCNHMYHTSTCTMQTHAPCQHMQEHQNKLSDKPIKDWSPKSNLIKNPISRINFLMFLIFVYCCVALCIVLWIVVYCVVYCVNSILYCCILCRPFIYLFNKLCI